MERKRGFWHVPRTSPIPTQGFHSEDHLRGDGALLIEHGIGESGFGNGPYFSGDAEGALVNGLEGLLVEDGLVCTCKLEVMGEIVLGFMGIFALALHLVVGEGFVFKVGLRAFSSCRI